MAKKDNTLKILTHILGLLTGFIGPLIVLLASEKKEDKKHSVNALNWQISLIIYLFGSFILVFFYIGIILLFALAIINMIFCIVAAVKASNDELWEYPLTIKFLS